MRPLSTVTVAGSSYHFRNLAGGEYRLTVDTATLPAGIVETYDLDGGFDYVALTLLPAETVRLDVDFGITGTGSIGDTVFADADGDGVLDPGEAGIAGMTVALTWFGPDGLAGTGDDVDYLAFTDAAGRYSIANLPAGDYQLVMVSNAGLATTPLTQNVTLLPGQAYDQGIFGFGTAALPSTGLDAGVIAWWGMLLIAAGTVAVGATRRRRTVEIGRR